MKDFHADPSQGKSFMLICQDKDGWKKWCDDHLEEIKTCIVI